MVNNERTQPKLELLYTLVCDDVRLEAGNKLSFMGVFYNIIVQQIPARLLKLVVVNHWRGDEGEYLTEVRILTPDRKRPVAVSQPASFEIGPSGFGNNISIFIDVTFPIPGYYWVQTLVNSTLFHEEALMVAEFQLVQDADEGSETVN